jgi:polyisoprenyl-phosphate glycosyltransferase
LSASTAPRLSVVVPVFGNAATLVQLHGRLGAALRSESIPYELIFVEDAGPDESLEVLRRLVGIDATVAVLALATNAGQNRAVLAGLEIARGEWCVILDADLQDPPEAIPLLLAGLRQGFSAVFAGRRGHYESGSRLLTSRVFKSVLAALTGLPRDAGIFVAIDRRMVSALLAIDEPTPFVVAQIGCTGLPCLSVPVERAPREFGASAYTSRQRLRTAVQALALVVRRKWWRGATKAQDRSRSAVVRDYYGARFRVENDDRDGR